MPVNLATVDLRLLVVFDALATEKSVTRAARRLGMSQPAVSNALNRLRRMVGDPLFLRTNGGMRPTSRALELAEPIHTAMRRIEEALEPATFEPEEAGRTFRLAVSDHASVVMLPVLIEHMSLVAPRVALTVRSVHHGEVVQLLDEGEIDLAIGILPDLPKRFDRMDLFDDTYVCMMRRGHRLAGRPISKEDFAAVDHLAIKPGSLEDSRADRMLAREGARRRTVTMVHQFLAAPAVVSRSDMVVLVFDRMMQILDPAAFYFCPVPFDNMDVTVSAAWSSVQGGQAAHKWMRRQVADVSRRIEGLAAAEPGCGAAAA